MKTNCQLQEKVNLLRSSKARKPDFMFLAKVAPFSLLPLLLWEPEQLLGFLGFTSTSPNPVFGSALFQRSGLGAWQ